MRAWMVDLAVTSRMLQSGSCPPGSTFLSFSIASAGNSCILWSVPSLVSQGVQMHVLVLNTQETLAQASPCLLVPVLVLNSQKTLAQASLLAPFPPTPPTCFCFCLCLCLCSIPLKRLRKAHPFAPRCVWSTNRGERGMLVQEFPGNWAQAQQGGGKRVVLVQEFSGD